MASTQAEPYVTVREIGWGMMTWQTRLEGGRNNGGLNGLINSGGRQLERSQSGEFKCFSILVEGLDCQLSGKVVTKLYIRCGGPDNYRHSKEGVMQVCHCIVPGPYGKGCMVQVLFCAQVADEEAVNPVFTFEDFVCGNHTGVLRVFGYVLNVEYKKVVHNVQ